MNSLFPKQRPSPGMTGVQAVIRNTRVNRELEQRSCLAVDCHSDRISAVHLLFRGCSPSAIAGFVVPVIVDAVKGSSARPISHVLAKRGEVLSPLRAHLDATAAVVGVFPILRILAAINCSAPSLIGRSCPVNALPVPKLGLANRFAKRAATALAVTGSQLLRLRDRAVAAVALAKPCRVIELVSWRRRNGNQSSKALTSQIRFFHLPIIGASGVACL